MGPRRPAEGSPSGKYSYSTGRESCWLGLGSCWWGLGSCLTEQAGSCGWGGIAQFHSADRKQAWSLRLIWVRAKERGSVTLIDQSTRGGERDVLELELEPCPCWELSFAKVRERLRGYIWGLST